MIMMIISKKVLISAICATLCMSQINLFGFFNDDTSQIFGTTATGALLGGAFGGGRGAAIGAGVGAGVGIMSTAARRDRERRVQTQQVRSQQHSTNNLRRELRDLEARRDEIQEELRHAKNERRRQRLENELDDVTHDIRDIRRNLRRG
jgi:uncharacterized protein HemX